VDELKQIYHRLDKIYPSASNIIDQKRERYQRLDDWFSREFEGNERHYFSTPGRTEIGGNHTDHNYGRVLAASVDLDSIAVAGPTNENQIVLLSEGFDQPFKVNLNELEKNDREEGTTTALIRGIASRLKQDGKHIGGFQACMTSDVLPGSGLSSSASVEVLIGSIFNALYNDNTISVEYLAKTGQYAENEYFGKPCGLMDQMACAVGGVITIDFEDPAAPLVKKVPFDFAQQDYKLLVVDTGGNHADLTPDYAAVPQEMKAVAILLGKRVMRELSKDKVLNKIDLIRKECGDRALLRAFHFINENQRVSDQVNALEQGDFDGFLKLVNDSGNSSFKWLQNVYTTRNVQEQGISLALSLTEDYISRTGEGACRVHGGGFAGTILTFLPTKEVESYIPVIETVFGKGCVNVLTIRDQGCAYLNTL